MWLSATGMIFLFLYVNPVVSREACTEGMTVEAILSLARIMKENSQKLERHEVRERLLGEHMKKVVGALTKKVSILDTFVSNMTKIEGRIFGIEKLISQRDERERIQMQKTVNLIEDLETRLEARLTEIKSAIAETHRTVEGATTTESRSASDIISRLQNTESNLLGKVTQIESSLNTMAIRNTEEAARQAERLQSVFNETKEKEQNQKQFSENLLSNLENRLEAQLEDIKSTIQEVRAHVEPTQQSTTAESVSASDIISKLSDTEAHFLEKVARIESSLGTMATKNQGEATAQAEKLQTVVNEVRNISGRLGDIESSLENADKAAKKKSEEPKEPTFDIKALAEEQSRAIGEVTEIVKDTANRVQNLPTTSDVQSLHNETQAALQEAKDTLLSTFGDKIDGVTRSVDQSNVTFQESILALRSDLATNAERVNAELRDLASGQIVMVTTADQVLDTKRRVEYGVRQILQEVGELIKSHSTAMNETLNERFGGIANNIIGTQSGALANLTAEMEQELDQVWRQINIMYQQVIETAATVNKIDQQNEAYINGTISTVDGIETKVSDIKQRMADVDGNLNYFLGRLSLMSQEFNKIKADLGSALNKIKASFKEVQEQANDLTNPGPHQVPKDHQELDDHWDNSERSTNAPKFDLTAN